jgi:hypothetical protein
MNYSSKLEYYSINIYRKVYNSPIRANRCIQRFPSFRSVLNRPPVKHFPHKRPPLGPTIVAVFEGDLDRNNLENFFGRPKPLRTVRQRPDRMRRSLPQDSESLQAFRKDAKQLART